MATATTTTTTTTAFAVPEEVDPARNFNAEFNRLCTKVNPVNHGEFEMTVNALVEEASVDESASTVRARPLALQRCRRGGKTFMLHAVASRLSLLRKTNQLPADTHIIFISLNSGTAFAPMLETAYGAILSRIAWELTGRKGNSFIRFRQQYHDFGAVDDWLFGKKIILIIDELNVIPYTANNYHDMSSLLDNIVQRDGCAVLYSTHQRGTADLLRGRLPGTGPELTLSRRPHLWQQIPRIVNENCLRGLYKEPTEEASFWSAVLRGRLPALVLQDSKTIEGYTEDMFLNEDNKTERNKCLKAVITGEIDSLPNARNLFRAYSYMSERFTKGSTARYAWPPFMIAQYNVLGKEYRRLRATLEHSSIDEPKAFEALTQLAILIRLLTQMEHELVPMNVDGIQKAHTNPFDATELFYVGQEATDIARIINAVALQFSLRTEVQQVVAVPLFASFPVYDFFVLHRTSNEKWEVAAGYQCKQGNQYPKEGTDKGVPLSVWLEGKCRTYRVDDGGCGVGLKHENGWVLMGESNQADLLGVSVSEALPQDPLRKENLLCTAEMHCKELQANSSGCHCNHGAARTGVSEPPAKKSRGGSR